MLLCNVKFSLLGLFLPQHAACQCLLFIFVFTFAFASVLELVWGYITVQAGRPRGGIWRIGWFAGVERTREPLLYCTAVQYSALYWPLHQGGDQGGRTRDPPRSGQQSQDRPPTSRFLSYRVDIWVFWVSVETSRELWSNFLAS